MPSLKSLIKKYHKSQSYVRVFVDGNYDEEDGLYVKGYIMDYDDTKIVISQHIDFVHDGFVFVPIYRIGNIYHTKDDDYYNHIVAQEGLLSKIGLGYKDVFELMSLGYDEGFDRIINQIVIIKCDDTCKNGTRHIGCIESFTKKGIQFRYFDARGRWKKKPYYIPRNSIMTLEIGDNYSITFAKYTEPKPIT